jgi:hypothetical protein
MNTLPLLIVLACIPVDERLHRPFVNLSRNFDHCHTFYDRPPLALWTRERFACYRFTYGVYGESWRGLFWFGIEGYWLPMGTGQKVILFFGAFNTKPIIVRVGIPPDVRIRMPAKGGAA